MQGGSIQTTLRKYSKVGYLINLPLFELTFIHIHQLLSNGSLNFSTLPHKSQKKKHSNVIKTHMKHTTRYMRIHAREKQTHDETNSYLFINQDHFKRAILRRVQEGRNLPQPHNPNPYRKIILTRCDIGHTIKSGFNISLLVVHHSAYNKKDTLLFSKLSNQLTDLWYL
jgi:hypothetical protein